MPCFRTLLSLSATAVLGLCGCSANFNPTLMPEVGQVRLGAIQGTAHGGRQPIAGAHLYVYAAGTTGYGSASTSLLTAFSTGSFPTTKDANNNYYVTSDANGNFSITGEYTCTVGTQVYLYGTGGNAGSGSTNAATGLLAALGQCGASGLSGVTTVYLNEVSTVAAAYALGGYAVDPTHIGGTATTQGALGLANAFALSQNLYNSTTGGTALALTTTPAAVSPAVGANGTVPQAQIHAIANGLAACVNSTGAASTQCSTLFSNTRLDGTTTGTQPTDTAGAAIAIAHYPGVNVATIYGLTAGIGAPFQPTLASAPHDFTVAISYKIYTSGAPSPQAMAIDASGNVWTVNPSDNTVSELSPTGAILSPAKGFSGGGLNYPYDLAIDVAGKVWVGNTNPTVTALTPSGTIVAGSPFMSCGTGVVDSLAIDKNGNMWCTTESPNALGEIYTTGSNLGASVISTPYTGGGIGAGYGVAVDAGQTVWVADYGTSLTAYTTSGTPLSATGFTGGGISFPLGIAIDASGYVWTANYGNNSISKFYGSTFGSTLYGKPVSSSTGFTGGGLSKPSGVAVDGVGNVWVSNKTGSVLSEFNSAGTPISSGYSATGGYSTSAAVAVDPSGNVWVLNHGNGTVTEVVGAGAPVVTPLAAAVANN